MNKPVVYGGVGEYGRACFYIEVGDYKILLDAGIMKGKGLSDQDVYPQIPDSVILTIDIVWLSHSHIDHVGFLPRLVSGGFQGKIISSLETKKQLLYRTEYQIISEQCEWETLQYPGKPFDIVIQRGNKLPLKGKCGATGHLIGSLWLKLIYPEGSLIYTGDMSIESCLYKWDDVMSEKEFSWGIVDQGYDTKRPEQQDNLRAFHSISLQAKKREQTLFLPLPKHGRSLEILLLLYRFFKYDCPSIYIDPEVYKVAERAAEQTHWFYDKAQKEYRAMLTWVQNKAKALSDWFTDCHQGFALLIVADSGLEQDLSKALINTLRAEDQVILSGNPGKGSYAESALNHTLAEVKPKVSMLTYNVHLTVQESQIITKRWSIRSPIYFHGKHNPPY